MKDKNVDGLLPVKWSAWDMWETLDIVLYDVEFTADFGCFAAGESVRSLHVHYVDGYIEELPEEGWADIGRVPRRQFMRLAPKA